MSDGNTPAFMRHLANKYTNRHQIVLPCPRDEEAAAVLLSAADQIDHQAKRIAGLEAALQREQDGCRRICAGAVSSLSPDLVRHFQRMLDRINAALAGERGA